MIVVVRQDDGTEIDITEGVRVLFDLVTSSMDWGSGFWTVEDVLPVADVARVCGFPELDRTEAYLAARAEDERRKKDMLDLAQRMETERQRRIREGIETAALERDKYDLIFAGEVTNDHAHSWELNGITCVWPGCTLQRKLKEA